MGKTLAPFAGLFARDIRPESAVHIGDIASGVMLSQLDHLRLAVRAAPDKVCGLVVGLPFEAVERTLHAADFDTRERLVAFSSTRRHYRMRDATGARWELSMAESEKLGESTRLRNGQEYAMPADIRYRDRAECGKPDRLRHRDTGAELPRPARLTCEDLLESAPESGFECLSPKLPVEDNLHRIRHLDIMGLNADLFLTQLLRLIDLAGEKLHTPLLYRLINDDESRAALLEKFVAGDPVTAGKITRAALDSMESCMLDEPPPLALDLVNALLAETFENRRAVTEAELLTPGRIWHIDPSRHASSCIAYAVKDTLQRAFLEGRHAPGSRLLISIHNWYPFANLRFDEECLRRADTTLIAGIVKAGPVLDYKGGDFPALLERFPAQHWHRTADLRTPELFETLTRDNPHAREKFRAVGPGKILVRKGDRLEQGRVPRHADPVLFDDMESRDDLAG